MSTSINQNRSATKMTSRFLSILLIVAVVACLFVGESMAGGKGKGEDDIILYNGNIVLRGGGGGKGKGKGGSIVVANSPQGGHHEYMPMFDHWGDFGRRRK